jgi:hypothetical protein
LNGDNKHDPQLDSDDDGESHAADEPTAVWDESALRAAGLTDLLSKRKSDPPPPPATKSVTPGGPSIEVSQEMALPEPEPEAPREMEPATPSRGLGWGATLALAIVLGGLVYALIRYVKG